MPEQPTYIGTDLEAMAFAENYHRWILERFKPYLGDRIVEVGAGVGSFSRLLLEESPDILVLVEPSAMFEQLTTGLESRSRAMGVPVLFYNSTFTSAMDRISPTDPDTIIYVNVLEHIEDDGRELSAVYSTLGTGGRCMIFVPAMKSLYGEFDRIVGHHRRYSKNEIEEKCRRAGFRILESSFFDVLGVVPWLIKYRLLRSATLGGRAVRFYDRAVVPVGRVLERMISPPVGKNLLLVVTK